MSNIYLLKFIKRVETKIDGHFILKVKENFMVFTSKPVKNMTCHVVSNTNIKGKNEKQYIADHVHKFDSTLHRVTQTPECITYHKNHHNELIPWEKKLEIIKQITEK